MGTITTTDGTEIRAAGDRSRGYGLTIAWPVMGVPQTREAELTLARVLGDLDEA